MLKTSAVVVLFACLLSGARADTGKVVVETAESAPFASGGAIDILDSFGEVQVEGWDKPDVEIKISKGTGRNATPEEEARARAKLERVKVVSSKKSADRLQIASTVPFRNNLDLTYRIKVPRETHLTIRHDIGEVKVVNVSGNITVTNRIGEIDLRLPENQEYEIDARSRIGGVDSQFKGKSSRPFLVGEKLVSGAPGAARRIYLRVGIGGIEIHRH